jgi:hypothetical protein
MAGSESGAGEDQATQIFPGQDAVIVTELADPPGPEPQPATELVPPQPATEVGPPPAPAEVAAHQLPTQVVPQHPPTEVAAPSPRAPGPPVQTAPTHPPTEVAASAGPAAPAAPAASATPLSPVAGIVRYGPGIPVELPVSQGGRTAEHVWSGGSPPPRSARLRRLGGSALTVILLLAAGVVLFLRFYHPPFQVTGAAITQHPAAGCRVDVTGRITTNGAAGTVSYRWLFKPGAQQATTLRQSVTSGQHAVDVTVAVEGSGHGSASQTAILQVLSPDRRTASTRVALSC